MNAYEKIEAACKTCGVHYAGDRVYTGRERTYVTCNAYDERITLSGDDEVLETSTGLYVHLFLPRDAPFFSLKRKLQDALVSEGLEFPEMVSNTIEDNSIRHLTFETSDEERG